jgi:predicted RNase H-like HicB family nuclease
MYKETHFEVENQDCDEALLLVVEEEHANLEPLPSKPSMPSKKSSVVVTQAPEILQSEDEG